MSKNITTEKKLEMIDEVIAGYKLAYSIGMSVHEDLENEEDYEVTADDKLSKMRVLQMNEKIEVLEAIKRDISLQIEGR